ncbi:hypothetical protein C5167_044037, partial [Papaver somniferum]
MGEATTHQLNLDMSISAILRESYSIHVAAYCCTAWSLLNNMKGLRLFVLGGRRENPKTSSKTIEDILFKLRTM